MNSPAASLPIVRDALSTARLLQGSLGAGDVSRLLSLATPYLSRPADGFAASLAGRRESVVAVLAPAIRSMFLPALHDRLVAVLRGTETEPDAASLADALAGLRDLVTPPRLRGQARLSAPLAAAVRERAAACVETVQATLGSDDFPDVAALSNDLLRLEALRWIVALLGDRAAEAEVAYQSRRIARITLTRATATVERFLDARDLLALFDNAAVVSQVDNLLVVATRVLDARAAGEEERTAFVDTDDHRALVDFIAALDRLAAALFAMAGRAAARPAGGETFFRSLVRQIECLVRFCRHLDHGNRPAPVDAIEIALLRRLGDLVAVIADSLGGEADDTARANAGHLVATLAALDLMVLARPLWRHLRIP